ncbi:helix-turn-helix domain-containing protein [Mycobacterium florentinum]|uniref:helix-turn-helix domain-containing protein n=1 Tax=Mycobacterium florentinum TaxID=292462 RepID=UPI00138B4E28|nr:helix-turn-helix domain-containing protein [Mycobacterium florentinum]BBX78292.1 hypothetical protein MFLOJ_20790 [Mycobacterium florentinum]
MSKARLVITAVLVEGRSQSQVARDYGVSQGWISRLLKRYTLEGEAAFEPRSRRPHSSPTRLAQTTIELIIDIRRTLVGKGLDAGPHTIAWHRNTTTGYGFRWPPSAATSPRRDSSNPAHKAAQSVLHPLCRRTTQRTLASRLHPLVFGQ